jgi:hypothetical protein
LPAPATNLDRRRNASAQPQLIPELPKLPSEDGVVTKKDFNAWIARMNAEWRPKSTLAIRGGIPG